MASNSINNLPKGQRKKVSEGECIHIHPILQHKINELSSYQAATTVVSLLTSLPSLTAGKPQADATKTLAVHTLNAFYDDSVPIEVRIYMLEAVIEVLFAPGSHPIHRPLLSNLKNPPKRSGQKDVKETPQPSTNHIKILHTYVSNRIRQEIKDNGGVETSSHTLKPLIESLLFFPEYRLALANAALEIVGYIVDELQKLLEMTRGADPSMLVMIPLGDSINDLSALLLSIYTHFTHSMLLEDREMTKTATIRAAQVLLSILQEMCSQTSIAENSITSSMLGASALGNKEMLCTVSSALYQMAGYPLAFEQGKARVAAEVAQGLLVDQEEGAATIVYYDNETILNDLILENEAEETSWVVEALKQRDGSSLAQQVASLPEFAALSAVRGLIQTIHADTMTQLLRCMKLRRKRKTTTEESGGTILPFNLLRATILYVCKAVSTTQDTPTKHLALQILAMSLEKLLMQLESCDPTNAGLPTTLLFLSRDEQQLILSLLWPFFHDSVVPNTRLAQQAFSYLLQIVAAQEVTVQTSSFFISVAHRLLSSSTDGDSSSNNYIYNTKGLYAPLATLIPHVTAVVLLSSYPNLIESTLAAMGVNVGICSSASSMLTALWIHLKREVSSSNGGDTEWRRWWLPQLKNAIAGSSEGIRQAACVHAVPALLSVDPNAFKIILLAIVEPLGSGAGGVSAGSKEERREDSIASVVALLSTGRKLGIIAGLEDYLSLFSGKSDTTGANIKGFSSFDLPSLLDAAAAHPSSRVRASVLELACLHPKTSVLPTALELSLVTSILSLDFRTTNAAVRQRTLPPLGRLLTRIRISTGALVNSLNKQKSGTKNDVSSTLIAQLRTCSEFLQHLCSTSLASCYPGGQYGRRFMALQNLLENHRRRNTHLAAVRKGDQAASSPPISPTLFSPFPPSFMSSDTTKVLLHALLDSWDKVRDGALEILLSLPSPLEGVDSVEALASLIRWGLQLLSNPRLKDADAGARLIHIVFKKYVVDLGWRVAIDSGKTPVEPAQASASEEERQAAVLAFYGSIVDYVEGKIAKGEENLEVASAEALVHGPLLAVRYVLRAIPWRLLLSSPITAIPLQATTNRLLATLSRLNALVLPVLSNPEEMSKLTAAEVDSSLLAAVVADETDAPLAALGPAAQVITCACWMSAKEAALIIGTLVEEAPIVGGTNTSSSYSFPRASDSSSHLLTPQELVNGGELLLNTLLESKHNGAVDKTQQGLEKVVSCLLSCSARTAGNTALTNLTLVPYGWLKSLFEAMQRPGQTRRDIVRRSAGLPFAVQAVVRGKVKGGGRVLVGGGMSKLLDIGNGSITTSETSISEYKPDHSELAQYTKSNAAGGHQSKGKEDYPWPRVHAFNTLRILFSDADLTLEASPYYAEGLLASIGALAAPQWEVRNSATLCFTALLVRILGFSNLENREKGTNKRTPTVVEFFQAYPQLQMAVLGRLKTGVERVEEGVDELDGELAPMLTLLMRLKPLSWASNATELGEETSGPAADTEASHVLEEFVPLIRRCASARPMAVRQMAAKALMPLVPPSALPTVVAQLGQNIKQGLTHPGSKGDICINRVHGEILQLISLLAPLANVGSGSESGTPTVGMAGEKVLAVLLPCLDGCLNTCAVGLYPCAPISHSMLRLMNILAQIGFGLMSYPSDSMGDHGAGISSLLYQTVQKASEVAYYGLLATKNSMNQAMLPVAFKEAVTLCMLWSPLLPTYGTRRPWIEKFSMLLQHWSADVRAALLKATTKALLLSTSGSTCLFSAIHGSFDEEQVALIGICSVLGVHLTLNDKASEQHPKVLRRCLQALALCLERILAPAKISATVNELNIGLWGCITSSTCSESSLRPSLLNNLFSVVAKHAMHAGDSGIKEYAISALGSLYYMLATSEVHVNVATQTEEAGALVIRVAHVNAQPEQIPKLRGAAVSSLASSGLLSGSTCNQNDQQMVEAWRILLELMEDEDEDVRNHAGGIAAGALYSLSSGCATTSNQLTLPNCYVEYVWKKVFPVLIKTLGPSIPLLHFLTSTVCPVDKMAPELLVALQDVADNRDNACGGVEGRLFDKEVDNHHKEALLGAQIAAKALRDLVISFGTDTKKAENEKAAKDTVLKWVEMALHVLKGEIIIHPGYKTLVGSTNINTISSAAEWENVFVPMYFLLLPLWVAGGLLVPSGRSSADDDVVKRLKTEIEHLTLMPASIHPQQHWLIEALWKDILKSWRLCSNEPKDSTYESFDSTGFLLL